MFITIFLLIKRFYRLRTTQVHFFSRKVPLRISFLHPLIYEKAYDICAEGIACTCIITRMRIDNVNINRQSL
jgi:hypothetical protein